jgi:hypothetical protein
MENATMSTQYFYAEMTDTFGGEPNYCWVHRFKVKASSMRSAIAKVARETGHRFRIDCNYGDMARYNARKATVCVFLTYFDEDQARHYSLKEI